jgi:polyhydroxyalkanoate synthesis regulator protein
MRDNIVFKKHPLEMTKAEMKTAANDFIQSLSKEYLEESMKGFGYSEERRKEEISDILAIRDLEMKKSSIHIEKQKTDFSVVSFKLISCDFSAFESEAGLERAA